MPSAFLLAFALGLHAQHLPPQRTAQEKGQSKSSLEASRTTINLEENCSRLKPISACGCRQPIAFRAMHWSSGTLAGWAHSPTSSPFQRREKCAVSSLPLPPLPWWPAPSSYLARCDRCCLGRLIWTDVAASRRRLCLLGLKLTVPSVLWSSASRLPMMLSG